MTDGGEGPVPIGVAIDEALAGLKAGPTCFYSEHDPGAAAWLRELISDGLITGGPVDERDIRDVQPADLVRHERVHLFSGIAGWERALDLAGWPADRPVWSGSCPCPPFSSAGKKHCPACGSRFGFYGEDDFGCERCGTRDPRHLWPEMRRLLAECRPSVCFGEQVASSDGREWLSRVRADLEALGYAVGAADLCAAGFGAPHIRQRLFWVAYAQEQRRGQRGADVPGVDPRIRAEGYGGGLADSRDAGRLAYAGHGPGRVSRDVAGPAGADAGAAPGQGGDGQHGAAARCGAVGRLADADGRKPGDGELQRGGEHGQQPEDRKPARPPRRLGHTDYARLAARDLLGFAAAAGSERVEQSGIHGGMGNSDESGLEGRGLRDGRRPDERAARPAGGPPAGRLGLGDADREREGEVGGVPGGSGVERQGSFWDHFAVIPCRDGKYRRVPGETQPGVVREIEQRLQSLASRLPSGVDALRDACLDRFPLTTRQIKGRVNILRGAGNAIVPQVGAVFIKAFLEATE